MTDPAREVLEQALKLSPDERVRLAHDLLESVDPADTSDFTQEWLDEIGRRVERVVAGTAGPAEDWRDVLDRIRSRRTDRGA